MSDATEEGFGVYVHWPFCAAKCPYCDFNSHVRHSPVEQAVFAQAYERELERLAAMSPGRTVTSIFFGGGTPSLMEPGTVGSVLDMIASHWTVAANAEITLEANPTSSEARKFAGFAAAGVNRVSIGVQSFDDQQLRFLGRLHDASQAREAVAMAQANFGSVSFDLIYARPGQTTSQWREELRLALSMGADHLSLYQLTIEAGTPFEALYRRGSLVVPDADHAAALYEVTLAETGDAGLPAYEVSNHARPGAECRHNLVYWRYHDYCGTGPGAHGRLTVNQRKMAISCLANPETWWQAAMAKGDGFAEIEPLTDEQAGDELLLMGLRLREGLSLQRHEQVTGQPVKPERVAFLRDHGLIEALGDDRIRATHAGFLVLDGVIADLAA